MNISSKWNFRSMSEKIMLGLVFAMLIGSVNVAPAIADDNNHGRGNKHDNGRYENRGRGHERNRHYRPAYRPYGYRERVYVAPPVVYEPPPSPGISIFFPPIYFRP